MGGTKSVVGENGVVAMMGDWARAQMLVATRPAAIKGDYWKIIGN
jgi:hypothetical protein